MTNRSICLLSILIGGCTDNPPYDAIPVELTNVRPKSIREVATDEYIVKDARMYGDVMVVEILTKGCAGHELSMIWEGGTANTYPVTADFGVVVDNQGHECIEKLTEHLSVDLSPYSYEKPLQMNITPPSHDYNDLANILILWE